MYTVSSKNMYIGSYELNSLFLSPDGSSIRCTLVPIGLSRNRVSVFFIYFIYQKGNQL